MATPQLLRGAFLAGDGVRGRAGVGEEPGGGGGVHEERARGCFSRLPVSYNLNLILACVEERGVGGGSNVDFVLGESLIGEMML